MHEEKACVFVANDLAGNAAKLVEYFGLARESDVPVARFTISTDGAVCSTDVGEGKYKSALLLQYLAYAVHGCDTQNKRAPFPVTDKMRGITRMYFGDTICNDAEKAETKHTTVRSLLSGKHVAVLLILKPANTAATIS